MSEQPIDNLKDTPSAVAEEGRRAAERNQMDAICTAFASSGNCFSLANRFTLSPRASASMQAAGFALS